MKKRILIAFGTRPEALKFVPLIRALKSSSDFVCYVCLTGQHREMLDQVVRLFKIKIDADLRLMRANQTLEYVSGRVIAHFGKTIRKINPDLVFVQGDTATAVMVALSSYYSKIPIAHLEAGLRTWNKYHPFPEEGNRTIISHLADYHFTPTPIATRNLLKEGISPKAIYELGNTIVDTVQLARPLIKKQYPIFQGIDLKKKLLFVTAHRRESFGKGLTEIFSALKQIVQKFKDVEIVYPVHLNPQVSKLAWRLLGKTKRIHLLRPFTYEETLWIMDQSHLILTDSGGIQEEAPSFKKPVFVLRKCTERPEVLEAGVARLVGNKANEIEAAIGAVLENGALYESMCSKESPFGDGRAASRIVEFSERFLSA